MRLLSVELGNDASLPNSIKHFVPADNAVALAKEEYEQVEDLGLQLDAVVSPAQLSSVRVELAITKQVNHSTIPGGCSNFSKATNL